MKDDRTTPPPSTVIDLQAWKAKVAESKLRKRERLKYGRRGWVPPMNRDEWAREFGDGQRIVNILLQSRAALSPLELRVLWWLSNNAGAGHDGPLTRAAMSKAMGIDDGNVSRIVNGLGERALIVNVGTHKCQDLRVNPLIASWILLPRSGS